MPGPGDANPLHKFSSLAQAGGVGEQDRHTTDRQRDLYMIPGGAGDICDDRPLLASDRIEKARLSRVRRAGHDYPNSVLQRLNSRPIEPYRQFVRESPTVTRQVWVEIDAILIDIVDGRLCAGRELKNLPLPFLHVVTKAALSHGTRSLALRFRLRLEKIGKPLSLRQIDATVLEGPSRELPRQRRTQARYRTKLRQYRIDDGAAAVALKLNDVFAGGASWPIKPQNKSFIQSLSSGASEYTQSSQSPCGQVASELDHRLMSLRATHANHADSCWRTAAGKSKDGVGAHERALVGTLTGINSAEAD